MIIDKKTFNAYRQVALPELKSRLKSKLHRVRQNSTESNYGKIELDLETHTCPFVEDHLCSIQRNLGEEMLSNTCSSYPRYNTTVAGVTQQTLTLSCPEAARLALLANDGFEFAEAEQLLRKETIAVSADKFGFTADQVNESRFFALKLIRSPELQLWEKLAALGVYCEQLEGLMDTHTTDALSNTILSMQGAMESGLITNALAQLPPDHKLQAVLFANIWKIKKGGRSKAQQRQTDFMLQGLGVSSEAEEITHETLTQRYQQGLQKLEVALQKAPHFLENYVANEMFRELFPFGTSSPIHHYLRLMTRYGVIRWMLAMRCMADNGPVSPEDLVETVQVFCKRYQHDSVFAGMVDTAFQRAGWDEVGKIYRFLRN